MEPDQAGRTGGLAIRTCTRHGGKRMCYRRFPPTDANGAYTRPRPRPRPNPGMSEPRRGCETDGAERRCRWRRYETLSQEERPSRWKDRKTRFVRRTSVGQHRPLLRVERGHTRIGGKTNAVGGSEDVLTARGWTTCDGTDDDSKHLHAWCAGMPAKLQVRIEENEGKPAIPSKR